MNEWEKHLSSDLKVYRPAEREILSDYLELIRAHNDCPEVLLYNFTRVVRTQEITKLLVFHHIFQQILTVTGSIVEAGVLEGNTLFAFGHMSEIFEHRNYTRRIYGFDSFEGYNLPNGHRIEPFSFELLERAVQLFNRAISFNQFERISLVKGDPGQTVAQFVSERPYFTCALLILHVGLYEAERCMLEAVWPRMPKGGVVLLGGFGYEGTPQCTKVIDDTIGLGNVKIQRLPFATKYCYITKS